jgi:hypothetical protein
MLKGGEEKCRKTANYAEVERKRERERERPAQTFGRIKKKYEKN